SLGARPVRNAFTHKLFREGGEIRRSDGRRARAAVALADRRRADVARESLGALSSCGGGALLTRRGLVSATPAEPGIAVPRIGAALRHRPRHRRPRASDERCHSRRFWLDVPYAAGRFRERLAARRPRSGIAARVL